MKHDHRRLLTYRHSENTVLIVASMSDENPWTIKRLMQATSSSHSTVIRQLRRLREAELVVQYRHAPADTYRFMPVAPKIDGEKVTAFENARLTFVRSLLMAVDEFSDRETYDRVYDLFDRHKLIR